MHSEFINRVLRSRFWLFLRLVPECFYRDARGIECVYERIGRLEGEGRAAGLHCGTLREVPNIRLVHKEQITGSLF